MYDASSRYSLCFPNKHWPGLLGYVDVYDFLAEGEGTLGKARKHEVLQEAIRYCQGITMGD